ncbi:hypothetical protein MTO96_006276 [Rhipicephalus appendiculatus]
MRCLSTKSRRELHSTLCADDWHHRFFNRYVPLFGVITLSLVAIALCLSYWCQDRNSPETESSRARLEEMRRMQCGERVAMYTMPPRTDTFTQQGCPGHHSIGCPAGKCRLARPSAWAAFRAQLETTVRSCNIFVPTTHGTLGLQGLEYASG